MIMRRGLEPECISESHLPLSRRLIGGTFLKRPMLGHPICTMGPARAAASQAWYDQPTRVNSYHLIFPPVDFWLAVNTPYVFTGPIYLCDSLMFYTLDTAGTSWLLHPYHCQVIPYKWLLLKCYLPNAQDCEIIKLGFFCFIFLRYCNDEEGLHSNKLETVKM